MYEYYVKLLATLFILLDHAAFTHVTDRGEACVRAIHCKMSYTFSSVSQPYARAEKQMIPEHDIFVSNTI